VPLYIETVSFFISYVISLSAKPLLIASSDVVFWASLGNQRFTKLKYFSRGSKVLKKTKMAQFVGEFALDELGRSEGQIKPCLLPWN